MTNTEEDVYHIFRKQLTSNIIENFNYCISSFQPNGYSRSINQCLGGLLSRQCTFVLEILREPYICTPHIAPILLRCMTEIHIMICWILQDPQERNQNYIEYGIGQQKLINEHMKKEISEMPDSDAKDEYKRMLDVSNKWVETQMADWAIEVNVGSWSGITLREMAQQTNKGVLYNIYYSTYTSAVHSSWHHIGKFNMSFCSNPLHKYHLVASLNKFDFNYIFMDTALLHLSETIELFTQLIEKTDKPKLPLDFANENFPLETN